MPAIPAVSMPGTQTAANVEKPANLKSLKMQGIQNSFSSYMQQNPSNTAQAANQKNQTAQEPVKSSGGETNVQQQYEQYQNQTAADKVTSAAESSPEDAEVLNEAIEEAVEDIKELIKENLGVDDEQLDAAMELLGLTQADLLNPQQLVALSVELTGSEDSGMMLFNENFQNLMQEVSVVTEELLQDLGMTMDELMGQLQEMTDKMPQQPDEVRPAEVPIEEMPVQETQEFIQPQETPLEVQKEMPRQEAAAVQPKEVQTEQPQEQEAVQTEQPQETEKLQQPQQVQEEGSKEPSEEQNAQQNTTADSASRSDDSNEQTRFDFHAEANGQEPVVHSAQPQNVTNQTSLPQVNMQDVIDQIVEHTKVHLSEDVKSIEMQLNPEHLGRVYLHVSEKQGAVTAQLVAQNEDIKEALVQQAAVLKENLNQQGIKVDAVEVSVGTHEFEKNLERDAHQQEEQARQQEEQNARRARRGINLNDLGDLDGLSGLMSEEEMLAVRIMRDNGNNVDFKA